MQEALESVGICKSIEQIDNSLMWETVKPTSNKQLKTTACNNGFLYIAHLKVSERS